MKIQKQTCRIYSVQANPIVGDIEGNVGIARKYIEQAISANADIVMFTELFIVGYPPEDLVLKPAAVIDCMAAIQTIANEFVNGPAVIIGSPVREGNNLYNAVAFINEGRVEYRFKHELPNYDVFDEKRVFVSGNNFYPVDYKGLKIGLPICEDIWFPKVCNKLTENGAGVLLVANGSPYRRGAVARRMTVAQERVKENNIPLLYLNQLGGQDELCFDGGSFIIDQNKNARFHIAQFEENVGISDWEIENGIWNLKTASDAIAITDIEQDYCATVLSLRDYINKNRFPGVLLGLSGGIDSAISAAMAVDALGAERVICVMMPSKYTSGESLGDAEDCANALGVRYEIVPIEGMVGEFNNALAPQFTGYKPDITEENIQSRTRAVILMALSNKYGHMVLTTGNKSEMAVGYATLYGDMCGGYNCLKDIYKTEVFKLSDWRNKNTCKIGLGPKGIVIPQNIIDKPPSAELRENQKDQDSLPPYEELDDMLYHFIELEDEVEDILALGYAPETVKRVQNLLYLAEYKRRQAPPGVKIGHKNFGRDRRYPITNKYRDKF
ncbi:NAD+ synthase [Pseudaquidulcibacter saccharophilus]|uniref:NAD+ synthase n=1 Tax=Pseudaquidulcibacter saccharophilus TaxID=2831900 RepID=UPI001EFF0A31|nr:NAD+ synthase [Pseudaquidulcibacter saccharophilus]